MSVKKDFFKELGGIFGLWCLASNAVRFLVEKSVGGSVTKMMKRFVVFVEDCGLAIEKGQHVLDWIDFFSLRIGLKASSTPKTSYWAWLYF